MQFDYLCRKKGMKYFLICTLLFFSICASGQTVSLEKEEQEMRNSAYEGNIEKQSADLNGDGETDFVYFYAVGELYLLRVYLQSGGKYVKTFETLCSGYWLESSAGDVKLRTVNGGCCGEDPFTLKRTYTFDKNSAQLVEYYIETDGAYTEDRQTVPFSLLEVPYPVKTLNEGYNLRFSPDTDVFEESNEENFLFTCLPKTNIIATLKAGARLRVLAEQVAGERTWLYVEVEETDVKNKCKLIFDDFLEHHPSPSVRGWVSSRYTERESIDAGASVYVFENDTIEQRLAISRLTDTRMDFTYTVENRPERQKEVIRGTAKYEHGEIGGVEIEEGEDGNGIAFTDYVCENGHRLSIRMD
jgi:hypothetical protein